MLEKPDLKDSKIIACLRSEYGLPVVQVAFLPIGADLNTVAYRVVTVDGRPYFFKLRKGAFDETSVALPQYLSDQGIGHIIAPLKTQTGQLWASLDAFRTILYPFVEGHDGYAVSLSDAQWVELGAVLKRIHTTVLPPALARRIRQETYSPQGREIVKTSLMRIEKEAFEDPIAVRLAAFLRTKRAEISDLVVRAERLARALQVQPPEFTLCHYDIHAGNILIGANGAFYVVDWDDPIMAPKERDLMYIGGGLMGNWRTPQEEETLFYRGYSRSQIDPRALAYYRYERIVQDIAVYCEQLLMSDKGGPDREQSFRYLMSNFMPNGTIEIARNTDMTYRKR